jgi:hypothetical protein
VKKKKRAHEENIQQTNSGSRTPPKHNNQELEENTPRNSNVKKSPAISSSALLSPSTWFKKSALGDQSEAKPHKSKTSTTDPRAKPPRFQQDKHANDQNILSPPSSNIFTTFSNVPSRHMKYSLANNDEDQPPSPPPMTDASTASSLLWEDNTLTSVSEEDAVAFRMYENSKLRKSSAADGATIEPLTPKHLDENLEDTGDYNKGDRFYCDRHGNLRSRDFDGFDNVILSVTIYATASCNANTKTSSHSTNKQSHGYPTAGEVIVMELLSTKNPPNLDDSMAIRHGKQRKVSSSSSSQTNPPPPPVESDSSAVSSTSNSQQQLQVYDEENEVSSNHTRIIAQRVLRWPSSIISLDSTKRNPSTIYNGHVYSNS